MKKYEVRMTMTVCVTVDVEAENREDAEKKALEKTGDDAAFYLHQYESVWDRDVVEVNECEEDDEKNALKVALDYVREQLGEEDVAVIRAQVDRSYRYHMAPSNCVSDDSRIIDLLEEYGSDNDLPEGWWENYGDIDDILLEL